MTDIDLAQWSSSIWKLRMRQRLVEAHFRFDDRYPEDYRREPNAELYDELISLEQSVENYTFNNGDESCLYHEHPIFGPHNPPAPDRLLYQYTRVATLPKIREGRKIMLNPMRQMNDPHEALDTHSFSLGTVDHVCENHDHGTNQTPLTEDEAKRHEDADWIAEINDARKRVKLACFAQDSDGRLRDLALDESWPDSVAERLTDNRGFSHPRMWEQYGDQHRGVCIIFDAEKLVGAFMDFLRANQFGGCAAPIRYTTAGHSPSLGFLDIRDLVRRGAAWALLNGWKTALFEKHGDWEHEAEFRLACVDGPDESVFIDIPERAIAGLIVGPKFDPEKHVRNIRPFVRDFALHGAVRQLNWTHGRPELHLPKWL